jgi:hypothetical protein
MGKKSFRVRNTLPKTRQLRCTDIIYYRARTEKAAAVAEAVVVVVARIEVAGETMLSFPRRMRSSSASTIRSSSFPRRRRMLTGRLSDANFPTASGSAVPRGKLL